MADDIVTEDIQGAEVFEEPLVKAVERLAALDRLDYEKIRKDEAKRLGIRASVLDREVNALRKTEDGEDDLCLFEPA